MANTLQLTDKIAVVLDLGTTKIRSVAAVIDDNHKVTQIIAKPDTFLEEAVKVFLEEHKEYEDMEITLVMLPEEELLVGERMSVTNLRLERGNLDGA